MEMADEPTPTDDATKDENLGEGGLKALQAERDARKQAEKAATDLQAKIDAIEAEKLSDLEKAQKEAEDAKSDAATARVEALRYKVAAANGISAEDAELLLTATTEEAMTAQAKRLVERAPDVKTPKPDLTQGAGGKPTAGTTGEQFANFIESKLK